MAVTVDDSSNGIEQAADTVRDGGTVIYPTETCYGLGCDATDAEAVERIYELKQRPREKGLTCIVADLATAEQYCRLTDTERALVEALMPGPLTLVAEKTGKVPDVLNTAFAFRIPGSETAQRLAEEAGVPVVATSANVSGDPSRYRVDEISTDIRSQVDVVIDAGELEREEPSTVVAVQDGDVVVHRAGPVSRDAIEETLHRS
ncbi:MAG: L-threonylcarbamoyladenylate synthase [Candidatus Nanohaloarchaea archaeon]